jgi:hypothetical protein
MRLREEVAGGPDRLEHLEGDCLRTHLDWYERRLDHTDGLIVDDELREREGVEGAENAGSVEDQVGAAENRGRQAETTLDAGLDVR